MQQQFLAEQKQGKLSTDAPGTSGKGGIALDFLMRPAVLLRICFILLTALYIRTITFDFVYDDLTIILGAGTEWKSIFGGFVHGLFQTAEGAGSSYYRPLPVFYIGTIQHLVGSAPAWFHIAAILIHLSVFYLAYVLGRYLFCDERVALLAALLFALHPTKAEPVAWIGSSACDGLGAIFFFGCLVCYFKWRESNAKTYLGAAILLYGAALLTKETLAVLPALIGVYEWISTPKTERLRRTLLLLIPFGVMLAAFVTVRHFALAPDVITAPSTGATTYLRPTFSVVNLWSAPLACWWFLRHLVFPTGLSVMYDPIIVDAPTFMNFVLPALGLIAVCVLLWWRWKRSDSRTFSFLLVWFLLTLGPYVVLAPMVQQHDRYLHLASYSFCAALAWWIAGNAKSSLRYGVGIALVVLFAVNTWHEVGFWETELTLWQRAEKIAPLLIEPRFMLADLYVQSGNRAAADKTLDEGLRLHPNSPTLWRSRALMLYGDKNLPAAKSSFQKAFEADNSGKVKPLCAFYLGKIATEQDDFVSAETWLRTAIQLAPRAVGYHSALATALYGQGRVDDGMLEEKAEFELAKRLRRTN